MQSGTNTSTAAELLKQGAGEHPSSQPSKQLMDFFLLFLTVSVSLCVSPACNVLYINSVDTESLTGPQAISRAVKCTLTQEPCPSATIVHFKVSTQGITLTDNQRRYTTTCKLMAHQHINQPSKPHFSATHMLTRLGITLLSWLKYTHNIRAHFSSSFHG